MAGHGVGGAAGTLRVTPSDVGRRVSVRRVLAEEGGRPVYADVVGTLTSWDGGVLVVVDRSGSAVRIPEASLVAGKPVPPPPVRRGRTAVAAHLAVGAAELQLIASRGWPAPTTEPLGGWRLRAAGGFTRRANSALACGDPGMPPDAALRRVRAWYAERGLPAYVQVVDSDADLVARLERDGWLPEAPALVLTAPLSTVLSAVREAAGETAGDAARAGLAPRPRLSGEPGAAWLARYHRIPRTGAAADSAASVLTGGPRVRFAELPGDGAAGAGAAAAIGRCAVDGRWAGFAAVEVDPAQRRRGFATSVMAALAQAAAGEGADLAYLQVEADNAAALGLYARLGFTVHHAYHYRRGGPEPV